MGTAPPLRTARAKAVLPPHPHAVGRAGQQLWLSPVARPASRQAPLPVRPSPAIVNKPCWASPRIIYAHARAHAHPQPLSPVLQPYPAMRARNETHTLEERLGLGGRASLSCTRYGGERGRACRLRLLQPRRPLLPLAHRRRGRRRRGRSSSGLVVGHACCGSRLKRLN